MHQRLQQLKKKPYYLTEKQIAWIDHTVSNMSTDKKIRQLFCMIAYTDDEPMLRAMTEEGFGGLMCRPMDKKTLIHTVEILQSQAKIPFLIAANMEAGMDGACTEGTYVGCQMAIAATNDENNATELGRIIGEEAQALGMNWAFAPVIDIDMNWRNPITNTRTYGADPQRVANMGSNYVKALQKYGVAASIKHFPGDGVDERDQHLVTSSNDLSAEEWMDTYGNAYQKCIDAGALTVMVGHIMQPAWSKKMNPSVADEELMPATLSEELLQGLLRKKLGFNGTTITDSSAMAGFGCAMARKDAIPLTVARGCDMILFTKTEQEDIRFVEDGVRNGVITKERLDEAVINVLALKCALGLIEKKENGTLIPKLADTEIVGCEEHLEVSWNVADQSVTLVKEEPGVLPLAPERYPRVLVYSKEGQIVRDATHTKADDFVEKLRSNGFQAEKFVPGEGFEGFAKPMTAITENYDLIIYIADLANRSNQTTVRITWDNPMGIDCPIYCHEVPVIFVSLENPYHLLDVPRIKTFINAYNASEVVMDAVLEKLMGKSAFKGVSPVDPFCGRWDARL